MQQTADNIVSLAFHRAARETLCMAEATRLESAVNEESHQNDLWAYVDSEDQTWLRVAPTSGIDDMGFIGTCLAIRVGLQGKGLTQRFVYDVADGSDDGPQRCTRPDEVLAIVRRHAHMQDAPIAGC